MPVKVNLTWSIGSHFKAFVILTLVNKVSRVSFQILHHYFIKMSLLVDLRYFVKISSNGELSDIW